MAIQRLFDGLRSHGVKSVIYCPQLDQAQLEDPLLRSGYEVQRFKAFVPVLGMSQERKRQLVAIGGNLMSFDLIQSLWREKQVSVIHAHTLGRIGGIALTMAKQRQLPFVVTVHGGVLDLPEKIKANFNAAEETGWEWGKLFGYLFQSHNLFRDASAIITCNATEAALLRERYPKKRVVVQAHGVPVELYQQDHREYARVAFPQIVGRTILLCLGRVDPFKNQAWLLEQAPDIFRRFPDALVVLAGACTDEPYGRLIQDLIEKRGLEGRVLLTGGFPPNDPRLIGLLQAASVLILPSVSETFGLVILEAWAARTPVLSSRTSGANALIRPGETGLLFELDRPETFHEMLETALNNRELSQQMTARSTREVEENFSITNLAGRMKELYQEAIQERQCAM
jgi:glycosyltransferase involved in cell wall biosynthesis